MNGRKVRGLCSVFMSAFGLDAVETKERGVMRKRGTCLSIPFLFFFPLANCQVSVRKYNRVIIWFLKKI